MQIVLHPSANPTGTDCSGANNLALTILPNQDNSGATATLLSASSENLAVVAEDFNQDGYEDLFVLTSEQAFAADPTDDLAGSWWMSDASHLNMM